MEIERRTAERAGEPDRAAEPLLDRWVRRQAWLEPVADSLQGAIGAVYGALGGPGRTLKSLLHGTLVTGHPLHPAITDVPIGAWIVGVVLDYVALASGVVSPAAGDVALAIGLVGAVGAALSGYTDFHETSGQERRLAVTHGLTMTTVLLVEAVSLGLRWWGPGSLHVTAVLLATLGLALALAGAYVGGHLVFGVGTMVNRNAFLSGAEEFVGVGASGDFPEGELRKVAAGGMPALVVRLGGRLHAISDVCSHAGGPLDEGTLSGDVVTCPLHGSRFCVRDGKAVSGPATFDQPAFVVREEDGQVALRLAHPVP